jgi:hypothetical protein
MDPDCFSPGLGEKVRDWNDEDGDGNVAVCLDRYHEL